MRATRLHAAILGMIVGTIFVGAAALRTGLAQTTGESVLSYLESRRDRTWSRVPRKVLAFYYTWYGRPERHGHWVHWDKVQPDNHAIATSTHYPAKGAYDSYDPDIIDYHIDLAKKAGIDAFICTWWGKETYDDRALRIVLERARKKQFHVTIYWETAPGEGQQQIDRAVRDLLYVLNRYGSDPAFLKVDGKPVVFVYGRVMNEVVPTQWPAIVKAVERAFAPGVVLIADGLNGLNARMFDGIHTYNPCGWVQKKNPDELRSASRTAFGESVALAKQHDKLSCLTVIPGYNDTKIRTPGLNAERQDGKTYQVLWDEAIRADPDWVLITSWNEWHEGSEIEPSWEYGDKYVRMTTEFSRRFKQSQFSSAAAKRSMSKAMVQQLQRQLAGRRIAVLPEYINDVVFWLADAGIELDELSWADVAGGRRLNADSYPMTLYAGGEHYRRTVQRTGDVEQGLLKYVQQGGLLMVMPGEPAPLYYDETGKPVASSRRVGLPIIMGRGQPEQAPTGWEQPPAGLSFTFRFNREALPDIPQSCAFPVSGDVRWRPTSKTAVSPGDVYVSLATLRDQTGRDWGDAIAYIEHKVSTPVGAKILYSWMRMADVVDQDRLWSDLFRFAAQQTRGEVRGER